MRFLTVQQTQTPMKRVLLYKSGWENMFFIIVLFFSISYVFLAL